ncbi:head maturation protease, ClpP-related [Paracoccus sp. NSM]|uniref:head maturation protease, ClpP-related n=1 Tax=Paracoccus sp. NSM TaxID=3457784 RepID=UPI00403609FF
MIPTLHIHGPIGEGQNNPPAIGAFLAENAGRPVCLVVNSFGGIAADGAAIMALIEQHGNVRAEVMGVAASAASLLVMGAARIAVHSAAHMMIHDPSNLVWGTAEDLRREADNLDKLADTYARAYSRATGHPVERVRGWMTAETWLTAEEAEALNFCDEVFGTDQSGEAVAAFDYTRFKAPPPAILRAARQAGQGAA